MTGCAGMHNEHGKPRVAHPQRSQAVIRFELPEETLPPSHPARVLWEVVGMLNVSAFLAGAKAVVGVAGRTTLSPRMKLTLWLYAISQGVGSAREIARLTVTDAAYRWIVGDLKVSHHALSAFRVGHGGALDALMTDVLASLMHKGVLSLRLVAQDGMRVRAWASAPSFRSYGSLLACREQAALPEGSPVGRRRSRKRRRPEGSARGSGAGFPAARRGRDHERPGPPEEPPCEQTSSRVHN